MLKCHLTNQSPHLHADGDTGARACARVRARHWGCNRMHMLYAECCQRQTVFFCIDYGWIKQTLVRFVYSRMTVSEQADQNILNTGFAVLRRRNILHVYMGKEIRCWTTDCTFYCILIVRVIKSHQIGVFPRTANIINRGGSLFVFSSRRNTSLLSLILILSTSSKFNSPLSFFLLLILPLQVLLPFSFFFCCSVLFLLIIRSFGSTPLELPCPEVDKHSD